MVQTQHTNAFETTLRMDFGPSALTAEVQSTDGSPASPCYLVIEPTNADRREYVLFDGTFTADQFVTSSTANRYLMPGSAATSGITHPAGSIVRFAPVAQHFTDHHSDAAPHLATSAATGNRLMLRDAAGRSKVAEPAAADDVVSKSYVDNGFARIATGSYTGDGTNPRLITLPFAPTAVHLVNDNTKKMRMFTYTGSATSDMFITADVGSKDLILVWYPARSSADFEIGTIGTNVSSDPYRYVAYG